ncbi:uncharacterized protein GGS22DRAFT_197765 [Annulohypoxylon maeteangense]|uniref:uncharacterized protein n=1 Tax=Annulohypoxylon maeteangense TaxID=1927788 RepID=UPI00200744BF|nr:uncharacterized protein GGS22DRAFT_197765 [Annulohypoxylon maeteangense]KAI0887858.1 hypothetical protein GGS22DRAFT_197765 [Annulohypoxylon maeteangense]
MVKLPQITTSIVTVFSIKIVSATTVGYFDSESCVDPSGVAECYENAAVEWSSCVNVTCAGQNIDCINVCSCVQTQKQLDCAGQHCWNQVYSCEYQQTAGDIATNCLNPHLDQIPFYPPPDNAPGSCSCNLGKLLTSLYRTSNEIETCGANGEDIVGQLTSNDEIQIFARACTCCSESAMLSAFWAVCPNTDPSLLGINEIYDSLIANDKDWATCATDMDAFPCYSKLGYTPPGGNSSGTFYEPNDFPQNGTATTSNIAGSITTPVSGAVYTWTYNGVERPITVASADAKPTNTAGANSSGSEDKKNNAPSTVPGLLFISYGLVLLVDKI